jgi:large subunit ribosomal protein L18
MAIFRRRKELKTNYEKRFSLLKSRTNRLVLRITNQYVWAQYVVHNTKGDLIKLSLISKILKEFGWDKGFKSLPASYLLGYLFGKKSIETKLSKDLILDLGLQKSFKKGRIYAFVKGAIDAGLNIPVEKDVLPSQERIEGKHIKSEALFKKVKEAIDAKK